MHPAAKLKDKPINIWEILPIKTPKKAPKPVVNPERVVIKIDFIFEEPLIESGRAIEIPSGISWRAIAIASFSPKVFDDSNPAPIASPSGKLWIASPNAINIPVWNIDDWCKLEKEVERVEYLFTILLQ